MQHLAVVRDEHEPGSLEDLTGARVAGFDVGVQALGKTIAFHELAGAGEQALAEATPAERRRDIDANVCRSLLAIEANDGARHSSDHANEHGAVSRVETVSEPGRVRLPGYRSRIA